jgi:hypothetical protein
MTPLNKTTSLLGTAILTICAVLGLVPVLFFVSLEFGIPRASAEPTESTTAADSTDRFIDNVAFGVGEVLSFDVNYGFINAGTASLSVMKLVDWNSRPAYQIVSRAESNSFFSTFYRVDDRIETIVDAIGMYSHRFEKKLREGSYEAHRQYGFDQEIHFTVYKGDTIEVPPFVQDALSTLYFVRTQSLKVGESVSVPTFIDGKQFHLEVHVLKKERLTVDAGTFDCLVVEPLTANVGLFKHEGKLKVWLTDDRLRMPVQMKSKLIVGSITAELTGYEIGELGEF